MHSRTFRTVIMAAGKGKRMLNAEIPKVMHKVNGKPLVDHVVDLALNIGGSPVIVIVGFKREMVVEHLTQL